MEEESSNEKRFDYRRNDGTHMQHLPDLCWGMCQRSGGNGRCRIDTSTAVGRRNCSGSGSGSGSADSFKNIHFSFDKYDLSPEARNILGKLADWLLEHSNFEVTIEGHCDDRGTIAYNLALGERRAEAAKAYLANMGIANIRITTISYGEELPADPGQNEAAWTKNRRDHFIVFPEKQ